MKAMLIILIVNANNYRITNIEVPMSTYEHCVSIADITGKLIAEDLGDMAYSVTTECIDQGE